MDINIETKVYDGGVIEVIRDRTARLVVNTTEEHIKQALKTLGWLSPQDAETQRAENAKLIAERDMLKLCADQNEDEVKKIHAELKEAVSTVCALRAEIDEYQAEREQYENHDVYATLYEDAKALIDPHTKASGGELPTSVIQSFECLFKFWIEYKSEREAMMKQSLAVFFGKMPESNGKSNWTAILYRKNEGELFGGIGDGITIARSEYEDRVRYDADCVRYLIGEIDKKPFILDYDSDKHSGYVEPLPAQQIPEGYTAIKTEVFKWLLGENVGFGDHSEYAPVYSWRKRLRDSVLSASQPKVDASATSRRDEFK